VGPRASRRGTESRIQRRVFHGRKINGSGHRAGPTPTTRILCGASSTPAVRVSMRIPPLDRQWAVLPGISQSSCTEAMLMMRPAGGGEVRFSHALADRHQQNRVRSAIAQFRSNRGGGVFWKNETKPSCLFLRNQPKPFTGPAQINPKE
jgi:hypothetical protein